MAKRNRSTKKEVKRTPSKHQIAKWQRQKRIQHISLLVGFIFILALVAFTGFGYYTSEIKPVHDPAMKIDDTVYDMGYFYKALEIYAQGQDANQVLAFMDQIPAAVQGTVLLRKSSAEVGISVTQKDIDSEIELVGMPNEAPFRDAAEAQLLGERMKQEYFLTRVPTIGAQVNVQAIAVESDKVAGDVLLQLQNGKDFGALAKENSLNSLTRDGNGEVGWMAKGMGKLLLNSQVPEDVAFTLDIGKVSNPTYDADSAKNVGYWLVKMAEKSPDKGVNLKVMLLGSQQEADNVLSKLAAGEDFGALARTYSQDATKDAGGDLDWQQPEAVSQVYRSSVIDLQAGKVAGPIKDTSVATKGLYWLVKVSEKDSNKLIAEDVRTQLAEIAFTDWFTARKDKVTMESYLDQDKKTWAMNQLIKDLSKAQAKSR